MLTILAFLVTLIIIVGVHELGHYGAARMCGVRVMAFSIGFGKPLMRHIDSNGTEWRLSPIPLGGYVQMLNDPEEAQKIGEPAHRSLEGIPRWRRAWVISAGPLANFALSFLLFYVTAMIGEESLRARVGRVLDESPAQQAGFVAGDEIVAVDGRPSLLWTRVIENLIFSIGDHDAEVEVISQSGVSRKLKLPTGLSSAAALMDGEGPLKNLGLVPDTSYVTLDIDMVVEGTPAQAGGLQTGDTVISVDDLLLEDWDQFVEVIVASVDQELEVVVARDGNAISLLMVPERRTDGVGEGGYLGVVPRIDRERVQELLQRQSAGPLDAIAQAGDRTVNAVGATARFLRLMLGNELSTKNLSGPVGIARQSASAVSLGPVVFMVFIAQLSLSLGLINLLPVPVLDGGHLLRYAIEGIIRRPLSIRIMRVATVIGVVLLLSLTFFTIYNDLR